MKETLQRFGGFMAAMVVPNIGAFIAWGLITALFIPTGWTPNETLSAMVGPMIINLLPLLIGYTGGKLIHGHRGGVLGALGTMGVIVGADIPMFLGGMIMGPIGGYLMKLVDGALEDSIPVGFEMLVNNFSAGILGTLLAIAGLLGVGPVVELFTNMLGGMVDGLVSAGLLPLADLVIEPAKVLFLNNALNHGVLAPLGAVAAEETGRAIHFLLETNPGPGMGLLISYWIAGRGLLKQSAPGAMIIHFLGGIHEIYFPYVLAHPIMIVALWAGGILADLWFQIFDAGLAATPSPGSIFAYLAVTPPGQFVPVYGGVLLAIIASTVVGTILLRMFPVDAHEEEIGELDEDLTAGVPV